MAIPPIVPALRAILALLPVSAAATGIRGTVLDIRGVPVPGATVSRPSTGATDTTDEAGRFALGTGGVDQVVRGDRASWRLEPGVLEVTLEQASKVGLDVFRLDGRRLWSYARDHAAGEHRIPLPPLFGNRSEGPLALVVRAGSSEPSPLLTLFGNRVGTRSVASTSGARMQTERVDSLVVARDGFARQAIDATSAGDSVAIVLRALAVRSWSMLGLPETGQVASFTSVRGEDSDYDLRRFSLRDRGDGTVLDLVTGLLWQKEESGSIGPGAAAAACSGLVLGGFDDWRLPDAHEAFSLQDLSRANPSVDTSVFRWAGAEYWWTSTAGLESPGRVWVTNAGGGLGAHDSLESVSNGGTRKMAARCVRGDGAATATHRYTVLSDSIVRDDNTGLEWSRYAIGKATWEAALALAESTVVDGRNDWRLPDLKEIQSLNDEGLLGPSLDVAAFPDAATLAEAGTRPNQVLRLYWSSTVLSNHPEKAWTIDFTSGLVSYADRAASSLSVRPVRGGFGR